MSAYNADNHRQQPDRQLVFLKDLLEEGVSVSGDVAKISDNIWALHGVIPVDRDVILAEYGTEAQARHVLDELQVFEAGRRRTYSLPLDSSIDGLL